MITINPQAADVITIQIGDADQIQLNTTAILLVGGDSGGGDADTLQGENGAYYLSRANHTNTQAISTVEGLQDALDGKLESVAWGGIGGSLTAQADLQDALDGKLNIVDYNNRFLGLYASILELETAHPTASAGDYAQVDWGIGTDVIVYVYDVDDAQWIPVGSSPIANTDALPEGSTNLYFTGQRVRDTPLTGLSTASATLITAADTVLSAAGKLQGQASANATAIVDKLNTADAPATVRATALTGLSTATATPITAADTVLSAAGKLQAQITNHSRRAKVPAVSGRFYTNLNFGGAFTSSAVAALQRRTIIYEPLSDMRVDQIGIVLAATATTAGSALLAVYEFDSIDSSQLNLLQAFPEIAVDTVAGAKMVSADYTFLVGRTYVFVLHVSQTFTLRTVAQTTQLAIGMATADGLQNTFWFLSTPYTPVAPATINLNAMSQTGSASVVVVMRAA